MTNETYNKAKEIQEQIDRFETLHYIANKPFKRYYTKTIVFGITTYDNHETCLCDEGLTEVIRDYCNKRLQELRDELAAL